MTGHDRPRDHLRQGRHDRLLRELEHDPYHSKRKIAGPAVCRSCGAVYLDGRWTWQPPPEGAEEHVCPACDRIADGVPAAFLTISGEFARAHVEEIEHLIANYAERQRAEHPLKRVMAKRPQDDAVVYTFTDAHLARGLGEALHHAYQGDLEYRYEKGETLLRVTWHR
jgi:hypothetical protein